MKPNSIKKELQRAAERQRSLSDHMPGTSEARHLACNLCSQLGDQEHALQHVQDEAEDSTLPEVANRLEVVRDIRPGHPGLQLQQCPECGTYYLYRSIYEFLIGFGGSYDEFFLTRLTDEAGADYREGRRSDPLPGTEY